MAQRNVLGDELEQCGTEPITGFYRDGCCSFGPEDLGYHSICAVMTAGFLRHQQLIGNDLSTPRPEYGFAGLQPGDPWCVTARNWLASHEAGVAAPVRLAATNAVVLDLVPLDVLRTYAVDAPIDLRSLGD